MPNKNATTVKIVFPSSEGRNELGTTNNSIINITTDIKNIFRVFMIKKFSFLLSVKTWFEQMFLRGRGFEPPRPFGHWPLKPDRLPIPTPARFYNSFPTIAKAFPIFKRLRVR